MSINSQQERIIGFLAQGLKPGQVASIVGCTPAYVSQLCGEDGPEGFREALQEKAKELASSETREEDIVGSKYLSTEHKVLKAIEDRLGEAEFPHLVQALKVIGDRQEKRAMRKAGLALPAHGQYVQNIVNISVPAHALPEIHMNGRLEVTAVDGRIMAPMSSSAVRQLFAAKKPAAQNAEQMLPAIDHDQVAIAADF